MKIIKYIFEILSDYIKNILNVFEEHCVMMINMMFIFMTYICFKFYILEDNIFITWGCVYIAVEIAKSFIQYVRQKNAEDEKDKFPMMKKRFTQKNGPEITVKKGDLPQALIYLSMIEDYRERNFGRYD